LVDVTSKTGGGGGRRGAKAAAEREFESMWQEKGWGAKRSDTA